MIEWRKMNIFKRRLASNLRSFILFILVGQVILMFFDWLSGNISVVFINKYQPSLSIFVYLLVLILMILVVLFGYYFILLIKKVIFSGRFDFLLVVFVSISILISYNASFLEVLYKNSYFVFYDAYLKSYSILLIYIIVLLALFIFIYIQLIKKNIEF